MAKTASELIKDYEKGIFDDKLLALYVDSERISNERERHIAALKEFIRLYGDLPAEIYSAPGRSEIGGNHTDHQRGKVLTASVNIDAIAVVSPTEGNEIRVFSEGYGEVELDISALDPVPEEKETTCSLIRGVAAGAKRRGFKIGGFVGFITSQVLSGSGLSSSAAIEVLFGEIFSGLYNEGSMDAITRAQIGQEAENRFFGKPSGLMDQMGCSVGGLVFIDFKDEAKPVVEKVNVEFESFGHSLCVVDTKGSHADLTDEYAGIPKELSKICEYFGKRVLREVPEEDFFAELTLLRKYAGDRAVLRAIHIYDDNRRVEEQKKALISGDFPEFCQLVRESGNSSYRYLQNVFSSKKPQEQSVAVALVMTKKILGKHCPCRVQGGGFAGTIEVFVANEEVPRYKNEIEKLFGKGSCYVLRIRDVGATKVF